MSTSDGAERPDLSAIVPEDIAAILGPPPVLRTEDPRAYEQLFAAQVREWDPQDTTEWLLVRDLTDLGWEILRLQRVKTNVLKIVLKDALAEIFVAMLPGSRRSLSQKGSQAYYETCAEAEHQADLYFEGPAAREKVTTELAKYDLDAEAIVAQAYVVTGKDLERLDDMLTAATVRRTCIKRDLNEHRAMRSLRQPAFIEGERVPLLPES
jgi:hypothetical protein